MKQGPWTSGPRELLDHAKDHLGAGTDSDKRLAMMGVDNAVELIVKTYLRLPQRVTGLGLTRKERDEHTKDFPSALTALEELLPGRITTETLGEIEYYHRIRNRLYHEANGITVERDKVQRYLKHAESLMRRLFPAQRGAASTRPKLTEQKFVDLLAEKAGPGAPIIARKLLTDLRAMNVAIKWRTAGFSARLPTPHAPNSLLTLLVVTADGTAYVGWLADQLARVDLSSAIARDYYERAAALFANCAVKTQPSGGLAWTRSVRLSELSEKYEGFVAIIRDTVELIKRESQGESAGVVTGAETVDAYFARRGTNLRAQDLYRTMEERVKAIDDEVWVKISDKSITYYSPERVFAYVRGQKTQIRVHPFTRGEPTEGVSTFGMKRGGHKWGKMTLKTEQDLDKVVAALAEAHRRIGEAIRNNENTGWFAELEGDDEDELDETDIQDSTACESDLQRSPS